MFATAYVQRDLSAKATAIAKTEVDSYIQSHPDLFNKRQVYNIEQVSFAPTANMDGSPPPPRTSRQSIRSMRS